MLAANYVPFSLCIGRLGVGLRGLMVGGGGRCWGSGRFRRRNRCWLWRRGWAAIRILWKW
jgi:hypothetical protein